MIITSRRSTAKRSKVLTSSQHPQIAGTRIRRTSLTSARSEIFLNALLVHSKEGLLSAFVGAYQGNICERCKVLNLLPPADARLRARRSIVGKQVKLRQVVVFHIGADERVD